jgi:hypothetical protein
MTREDILEEAARLMDAASAEGVPVRLIGGVAIRLHAAAPLPAPLAREYNDIDLVTSRKGGRATAAFLTAMGYEPNERFNAMNAGRRQVFYDVPRERQIDVFIGDFEMCHKLALADRLDIEAHTVPLAELLLTKLQIVELNRKDVVDVATILLEHDLGDDDRDRVNVAFLAKVLAGDWGLWRTACGSVETAHRVVGELGLDAADVQLVRDRLDGLWGRVEQEPKSMRWRARARVGERTRWYQMPEEIAHGLARGE